MANPESLYAKAPDAWHECVRKQPGYTAMGRKDLYIVTHEFLEPDSENGPMPIVFGILSISSHRPYQGLGQGLYIITNANKEDIASGRFTDANKRDIASVVSLMVNCPRESIILNPTEKSIEGGFVYEVLQITDYPQDDLQQAA